MRQEELQADWWNLGNYPNKAVREKIRARLARKGIYPNRSDLEELTQEGVAFTWQYFAELRPKLENAKHAVLIAAKQAARAVARGERFVAGCQGQRSVLAQSGTDLDIIPVRPTEQRQSDYSKAELIIAALPDHLRGIARLLAHGDNVESIAHKQSRHPKTIERNIREMRQTVRQVYWRLWDALSAALH